jgi:hypothetical protein
MGRSYSPWLLLGEARRMTDRPVMKFFWSRSMMDKKRLMLDLQWKINMRNTLVDAGGRQHIDIWPVMTKKKEKKEKRKKKKGKKKEWNEKKKNTWDSSTVSFVRSFASSVGR